MSQPNPPGACAVPPPSVFTYSADVKKKAHALMSKKAWPLVDLTENGTLKITYSFLPAEQSIYGWTENRENAVENTIKKGRIQGFQTWEDFANINFERVENDGDIRIAFEPGASWSAVGSGARDIAPQKPTLNLGWLKDQEVLSEQDRATILHEFGHALGLMHEHQSPARGQYINLKESEVYDYYQPLLGSRELVKSQIIDTYNESKIMNMSAFDLTSIMMYFMPGHLNEEGIDIPVNTKLSELDKAFITLNYPSDLNRPENFRIFFKAMITAGVSEKAAGDILDAFLNPKTDGTDSNFVPDLAYRLKQLREKFTEYNENVMRLRNANADLLNAVDPTFQKQFSFWNFLGSVVNSKLFESLVKVGVSKLTSRGKEHFPVASSIEVTQMLAGLAVHPQVTDQAKQYFVMTP